MKVNSIVIKVRRKGFELRWVLILIGLFYVLGYFSLPVTPGNSPYAHPLGWWGWFDQGQYLKAANAFLQHDFAPEKHFYPPLYPALGAFFLNWSSGHPYFLLNLFCLLWFAYVFIRVADRYAPRWVGSLLFLGTTIASPRIFENYLIPWTTTLSIGLLASGILALTWLQDVIDNKDTKISNWQVFVVALCLGLLVPTRPGDAVIGGLIGLMLFIGYFYARRVAAGNVPDPLPFLFYSIAGFAIGPAIYVGFNLAVFGTLSGGYVQISVGNGFYLSDIAEKFVSLWLDGETLYGETNAGLMERMPWLFLALPGLFWTLARGDYLLRVLALCITLLFALYMSYGDLLPNGLWRFLNIHYFKWTFPFLALFAWLFGKQILTGWRCGAGWVAPGLLLLTFPTMLLMLHLEIETRPLQLKVFPDSVISLEMPNGEVDFIDFKGLTGGFTEVYFGEHRVLLDGQELNRIRDFRLLPIGSNVRLLFIRPVTGRTIEFIPDRRIVVHDVAMASQIGTYHFALSMPKPFKERTSFEVVAGYRLGDLIDFSRQGAGMLYSKEGWSDPEDWGRWSVGDQARLDMHITGQGHNPLTLELNFGALVHPNHPCQKVLLLANGHELATQELCINGEGSVPKPHRYILPAELVSSDGLLTIRILTPDAVSPKSLGINEDTRILGMGLKSLRISE